jgi:hypothetical protein
MQDANTPVVIFGLDEKQNQHINLNLEQMANEILNSLPSETEQPVENSEVEQVKEENSGMVCTTKSGPGKIYNPENEKSLYEEKSLIDSIKTKHKKLNESWNTFNKTRKMPQSNGSTVSDVSLIIE